MNGQFWLSIAAFTLLLAPAGGLAQRVQLGPATPAHGSAVDRMDVHFTPGTNGRDTAALPSFSGADSTSGVPQGLVGALSGAIIGAAVGYRAAHGYDGHPPVTVVRQFVVVGAVIGTVVGYGIDMLVRNVLRKEATISHWTGATPHNPASSTAVTF